MRFDSGLRVLCAVLFAGAAAGAAPVAAAEGDVEERMDALERELEALRKDVADEDAQSTVPRTQEGTSKASKGLDIMPTWQVTKGITFKPGFRLQGQYRYGDISDHLFRRRFLFRRMVENR